MKKNKMKVVIPIAGLGTRFLPVTKVIPKEMLPINGKPIIHILLEEAVNAGCEEAILVINKEKEKIIKDYFSPTTEITKKITKKGENKQLKDLNSLLEKIKIRYVFQEHPLGDGHAILQAEKYIKNEPFAVLFGDDIVISKTTSEKNEKLPFFGLHELIETFKKTKSCVIGLEKIRKEQTINYGIVKPFKNRQTLVKNKDFLITPPHNILKNQSQIFEIEDMVEKPSPEKAPSLLGIIGKYVVTKEILQAIKKGSKSHGGELRLIDGFRELKKTQKIFAQTLSGTRYDTGTLEGYKKALSEI